MDDLGEGVVAPGAKARPKRRGRRAAPARRPPRKSAPVRKPAEAKSIVLFSDGTGNSSAKLFKTNVWRMYEAIDLGPSAPGKRDQIAYYDDGVGTSGFKPLAILGGVFGVGLKRNVLDIYQYACRNYDPGDHIYGFGFSRGAFTMRTAISLIADQGLVPYTNEAELKKRSRDAYRAYCGPGAPRYLKGPVRGYRLLRGKLSNFWRRVRGKPIYDKAKNHTPEIKFIGVWDTVSAYGGPIAEITRAIDNWFFPISIPNYKLNLEVQRARHALAIDDERDSFHPLLWDEIHERTLIARKEGGDGRLPAWIGEERLEQVWFTGMHADVGGGYPDESLSYVPLLWMVEEAEKAGLRTLDIITARYRAMANSFGPMHDSRAGVGAYYRYQPRKIAAWLDPVKKDTLSLRDPAIADESGPRGLVPEDDVKIHESVIARIQNGTDSYAPIVLPPRFRIVPPAAGGENQPQADSDSVPGRASPALRSGRRALPLLAPAQTGRFADPDLSRGRAAAIERLWNLVLVRRITYFLTVVATFALLSMPLWIEGAPEPSTLTGGATLGMETLFLDDGRNWIGSLVRLLALFLPGFLGGWIETYATHPFYFVLLSVAIVLFMLAGKALERRMRDRARAAWLPTIGTHAPATAYPPRARGSMLQSVRTSALYQRAIQITKWHVLPNVIFTPFLFLLGGWIVLVVATQARLPGLERGDTLCPADVGDSQPIKEAVSDFSTRSPCNYAGGRVEKDKRYFVVFQVTSAWRDGSLPATPRGLAAGDFPFGTGYLGAPLRRVTDAGYMQPLIAIRSSRSRRRLFGEDQEQHIHIVPLETATGAGDQEGEGADDFYVFEFTAQADGELFLFVNDAMLPFSGGGLLGFTAYHFYTAADGGNQGDACVTVSRADGGGVTEADYSRAHLCTDPNAPASAQDPAAEPAPTAP